MDEYVNSQENQKNAAVKHRHCNHLSLRHRRSNNSTFPIVLLSLKLPPPPCAVLLVNRSVDHIPAVSRVYTWRVMLVSDSFPIDSSNFAGFTSFTQLVHPNHLDRRGFADAVPNATLANNHIYIFIYLYNYLHIDMNIYIYVYI